MKTLKRTCITMLACVMAAMGAAGCNTVKGAGQDIQQGGEAVENVVENARSDRAHHHKRAQTITSTAQSGGSISPIGRTRVSYGSDLSFVITPLPGYHVYDVIVDGVSQGAASQYTFEYVRSSHTISARFARDAGR